VVFKNGQSGNPKSKHRGVLNETTQAALGLLWFKAAALVVFLQVPSLRDWFKYIFKYVPLLNKVWAILFMAVALIGYWFLLRFWPKLQDYRLAALAASKWLALGLFAAVLFTMLVVYPKADALKFQMAGSDQDDALIISAEDVLAGSPYASKTYLGNPSSCGPGWVLIAMPFSATGAYGLFFPSILVGLGIALKRRTGSWRTGNLFLLLASTGLIFWDLTAVGSDIIAWGCAAALALLAVEAFARSSPIHLTWLAMLLGCLATARIVFLPFPLLAGLFLWQRGDRQGALAIAAGGAVMALVLNLVFYLWTGGHYPPMHLIGRGSGLLNKLPPGVLVFAILAGGAALILVCRLAKGGVDHWMLATWVALSPSLALISFADLFNEHFDLANWNGANFLIPALPFLLCWIAWEEQEPSPLIKS
jgi:hypothetical protein